MFCFCIQPGDKAVQEVGSRADNQLKFGVNDSNAQILRNARSRGSCKTSIRLIRGCDGSARIRSVKSVVDSDALKLPCEGQPPLDEAASAGYHLKVNDERPSGIEDRADSNIDEVIVSASRVRTRARWAEMVFLAALIVCASLAVLANRYAYFEWDLEMARRIQSISLPGFGMLMTGVSLLGMGWYAWLLVILTGLTLIRAGLRPEGVIC